jgi:hypothetical protein
MKVLELVHSRELHDIQTIRQDAVRFSLEKVLTLICGDVRHCCENVSGMSSSALDTITVVDATLAGLCIYIEILEIVVKVNRPSTEISSKESSMGCEDRGDIDSPLLSEGKRYTCKPFVKMGDNRPPFLVSNELCLLDLDMPQVLSFHLPLLGTML